MDSQVPSSTESLIWVVLSETIQMYHDIQSCRALLHRDAEARTDAMEDIANTLGILDRTMTSESPEIKAMHVNWKDVDECQRRIDEWIKDDGKELHKTMESASQAMQSRLQQGPSTMPTTADLVKWRVHLQPMVSWILCSLGLHYAWLSGNDSVLDRLTQIYAMEKKWESTLAASHRACNGQQTMQM